MADEDDDDDGNDGHHHQFVLWPHFDFRVILLIAFLSFLIAS